MNAGTDSSYAWLRLFIGLIVTTVGSAGMYVVVVALPAFQQDFAISRAGASLPYTFVMLGFCLGGIANGHLADRYGIARPLAVTSAVLAGAFALAGWVPHYTTLVLLHLVIGWCGCGAVFGPLLADMSKWFVARRGLAVAIAASGNYLAGTVWPTIVYSGIEEHGWRATYVAMGIVSGLIMLPLTAFLRGRPDVAASAQRATNGDPASLGLSSRQLTGLLCMAGVGCCMAMAMPQVHMVSLCADRGFGAARGAEVLSVLLGCGIISRLAFGVVSDRLGGVRTLAIGAGLQGVALLLFLPADTLSSLYLAAGLFGLVQGGIVPAYAIIVREYFPAAEAGRRIGLIIASTILGMAGGGWSSGAIFDWSGSYGAAFIHGVGWNLVTVWVALFLLSRTRTRPDLRQSMLAGAAD